jgi:hypothetical protein
VVAFWGFCGVSGSSAAFFFDLKRFIWPLSGPKSV